MSGVALASRCDQMKHWMRDILNYFEATIVFSSFCIGGLLGDEVVTLHFSLGFIEVSLDQLFIRQPRR